MQSHAGASRTVEAHWSWGDHQPTLIANGDNDTMMITKNSHLLAHHLPNTQLRICPDARHGFLALAAEARAELERGARM